MEDFTAAPNDSPLKMDVRNDMHKQGGVVWEQVVLGQDGAIPVGGGEGFPAMMMDPPKVPFAGPTQEAVYAMPQHHLGSQPMYRHPQTFSDNFPAMQSLSSYGHQGQFLHHPQERQATYHPCQGINSNPMSGRLQQEEQQMIMSGYSNATSCSSRMFPPAQRSASLPGVQGLSHLQTSEGGFSSSTIGCAPMMARQIDLLQEQRRRRASLPFASSGQQVLSSSYARSFRADAAGTPAMPPQQQQQQQQREGNMLSIMEQHLLETTNSSQDPTHNRNNTKEMPKITNEGERSSSEQSSTKQGRRTWRQTKGPPPIVIFPVKLYKMLDDPEARNLVWWLPHGRAFRITRNPEAEEGILAKYFRTRRFESFQRQLNGWGFKRIIRGPDSNSYYHELFVRGFPSVCQKMQRPKKMPRRPKNRSDMKFPDFHNTKIFPPLPAPPGLSPLSPEEQYPQEMPVMATPGEEEEETPGDNDMDEFSPIPLIIINNNNTIPDTPPNTTKETTSSNPLPPTLSPSDSFDENFQAVVDTDDDDDNEEEEADPQVLSHVDSYASFLCDQQAAGATEEEEATRRDSANSLWGGSDIVIFDDDPVVPNIAKSMTEELLQKPNNNKSTAASTTTTTAVQDTMTDAELEYLIEQNMAMLPDDALPTFSP